MSPSPPSSPWSMHKFGGTSLAEAEAIRHSAGLFAAEPGERRAVVVSAMAGVTDALIDLARRAQSRDESYPVAVEALHRRHKNAARALLVGPALGAVVEALDAGFNDLHDLLRAVWLGRSLPEQTLGLISGYGELWSARLFAAHLAELGLDVDWLDAREVLVIERNRPTVTVAWDVSRQRLQEFLARHPAPLLVITGFVASTPDGVPTTLTRNGSDLSAAIFGALLEVSSITVWKQVDGALSADPRRVPDAVPLAELSYDEAMELAYFGAEVLHPQTLAPAMARGIPIRVRNALRPEAPGTRIGPRQPPSAALPVHAVVKGFSVVDPVTLLNVEGSGMIGVPGIGERLFGALRAVEVSVLLVSQASSEHSICFAVPEEQGELARRAVEEAFFAELHRDQIQRVEVVPGCAILAMIGDDMAQARGVAARFFGAIGKAGVNIRAIAQGSSERNISIVIDQAEATRALRAAHSGFYLSDQTLSVGLVGPGLVGATLLAQLRSQAPRLAEQFRIDLRVRGILDSRRMLLDPAQIPLDSWRERLGLCQEPPDFAAFADHVQTAAVPHAVIVDCSASSEVAAHYEEWLARGIHVITPNKRAGAGPLEVWERLRKLGRTLHTHFLYEATVGAGLPVIGTLRDLIQTGDRILGIEGVFSGTLSYVLNSFGGAAPFSRIVTDARARGYTEPDPRDDLSGLDVARKVVILAREMGLRLELQDVGIESLVPAPLRDVPDAEAYLARLPEFDAEWAGRLVEAEAHDEVLRYVGVVDPDGRSFTGLRRYPKSHPFARVRGTDNIFALRTARYDEQPMIIQGPGAGPEVTAAAVFADLLRLAAYLGAAS